MKLVQLCLAVISVPCLVTVGIAQEVDAVARPVGGFREIRANPETPYSLSNLMQVKLDISESEAKFVCLVESYREEERDGNVAKVRSEERVRIVRANVDGELKEVLQTFTVQVPYTEAGKAKVWVPAGKKPVSIDWEKAKLYRLDGSQVDLEDAKKLLSSLKTVFVVHSIKQPVPPADEAIRGVVKEDALVLATDELRVAPAVTSAFPQN